MRRSGDLRGPLSILVRTRDGSHSRDSARRGSSALVPNSKAITRGDCEVIHDVDPLLDGSPPSIEVDMAW